MEATPRPIHGSAKALDGSVRQRLPAQAKIIIPGARLTPDSSSYRGRFVPLFLSCTELALCVPTV